MNIHVADNAREAARMLLRNMLAVIRQPSGAGGEGGTVNVAFSGGSTPAILFDVWVEEFAELTPWNRFRVWMNVVFLLRIKTAITGWLRYICWIRFH